MTEEMKLSAGKLRNPAFRLKRPLYGWSRSGNIWEKYLAETLMSLDSNTEQQMLETLNKVRKTGSWKPVDCWPQTFWKHNANGQVIILTVYVDDFVMAGPDHRKEWESIRKLVTTTEPTIVDRVLGVHYTFHRNSVECKVTMDMCDYIKQALDMYHAVKDAPPLRTGVRYPWHDPDVNEINTLSSQPGVFQHCSASLLMKLLYAGRMVRLDICYAINSLSRFVTKWNKLCDKHLTHLFSYLLQTQKTALHAYVNGNDIDDIELHAFPDADLAGSYDTTRATSGGFIHINGPNTYFPLDWYSKRQTATSHSTTEAELISASKMLRESLIPLMELWSIMLQRNVKGVIHEDNQSTITVIDTGYSPQLRHLQKHHRISLGIVHELCKNDDIEVTHVDTNLQKGDIVTKGLARPKHDPACKMVGLYPYFVSMD